MKFFQSDRGFSIMELVVAMTVGLIIMGGVIELFHQGVNTSSMSSGRAEMQQNARVALNLMAQDLSVAGTGFSQGGIQLPTGSGSTDPMRGCTTSGCGAWNFLTDDRLYAITPGDAIGPMVAGAYTDVITVVYRDQDLTAISQNPLASVATDGSQITGQSGSMTGVVSGDVLMLCNANGCAAGVVTNISGDVVSFSNGDGLSFNQTGAAAGSIASISDAGTFPPTTAFRLVVVSYYVDSATSRLMRQVNAHSPVPVAEIVEDLQISYDTFDDATMSATADLPAAAGVPNQIRKINVTINVRGPHRQARNNEYDRLSLKTSVSARNLSFSDRYI